MHRRILSLAILLSLVSCTTIVYDNLEPGEFRGSLIVMWVGEGSASGGDGQFVFVPDPRNPLTFVRPGSGPATTIRPGVMYTDGGSVPKIAQVFKGLNPWGYAPAYMIHDWLFTAHHCIEDRSSNALHDEVKDVKFEDSAIILGEAIRGLVDARLVRRDDVAASAITAAVGSSVAKNLWKVKGACSRDKVTAKHLAEIEAAVPGSSQLAVSRGDRVTPKSRQGVSKAKPALVVTTVTF